MTIRRKPGLPFRFTSHEWKGQSFPFFSGFICSPPKAMVLSLHKVCKAVTDLI